jgi:hypothetical protein
MKNETITVINTENGQAIEVTVLNKRASHITVVVGQGIHSVQCDLTPVKNGQAYAGSVMGRELVYHRSRELVQADLDHDNPALKKSRSFRKKQQ